MLVKFCFIILLGVWSVESGNIRVHCYSDTKKNTYNIPEFLTGERESLKEDYRCRFVNVVALNLTGGVLRTNTLKGLGNVKKVLIGEAHGVELGAFENLPKLDRLLIAFSQFKVLDKGVFNYLPVADLILVYNSIQTIASKTFDHMPNVQYVHLDKNKLSKWDSNWFFDTPSLEVIIITRNKIRELPDNSFKNLQNVTEINFSENALRSVGEKLFGDMNKIKILNFSHNQIKSFGDGVLDGVESLELLDLSFNRIGCLSGNFDNIFVAKKTLLNHNPIRCDCKVKIDEWRKEHPKIEVEISDFCVSQPVLEK